MPEVITNQFFIRNFVTAKQSEDDIGPEIISDGQGLYLFVIQTHIRFHIILKN